MGNESNTINNIFSTDNVAVLEKLKAQAKGYWPERILSEIEYVMKLSLISSPEEKTHMIPLAVQALRLLETSFAADGAISGRTAMEAEEIIKPLSAEAKKYGIILISHAHIDMNWMWGFHETVAVAIDTFRTILGMMREYPAFTFAQSQASVYRIIEQYAPEMLSEIKDRIREGRWEVTASQWVEGDKNMASAESLARHLLYTRRYLSELLGLDSDYLCIDYEPDTFGHNANMPEILNKGGVKYYYHCRALDTKDLIYRWRAPSGSEVLVNREAYWYNGAVGPDMAFGVPEICAKYGIANTLRVYGVGDHGGGPTRRDIERILEYAKWPVFPVFKFGTYHEYFEQLEGIREKLPVVQKEINYIFTGCYTTQSRIKLANKIGEVKMADADMYNVMAGQLAGRLPEAGAQEAGSKQEGAQEAGAKETGTQPGALIADGRKPDMFEGWENVLFNQFHDILPGSGVTETREYTMGLFQKTLAFANSVSQKAMYRIIDNIDTSGLPSENASKTGTGAGIAEGAGVGYAIADYGLPQAERGRGKNRILHFFNPSSRDFEGVYEITIWDWPGEAGRFRISDSSGKRAAHNLARDYNENYWGHKMLKANVFIRVPAAGYSTYTVWEDAPSNSSAFPPYREHFERPFGYILENSLIRIELDTVRMVIKSIIDKKSGRELVDASKGAGLAVVSEQNQDMTAWKIGRYADVNSIHAKVTVKASDTNPDALKQYVTFTAGYGAKTKFEITYSLHKYSRKLDISVKCDWLETGGEFIPQLQYRLPLAYKSEKAKYSIPMGMIERPAMFMDVPACGMAVALDSGMVTGKDPGDAPVCAGLLAQAKYGFRLNDNVLTVTLIHSSVNPDKYPELGEHKINFSILAADNTSNSALLALQESYDHPVAFISGTVHKGILPLDSAAFSIDAGNVMLSSVKCPEDGQAAALVVRLYEVGGAEQDKVKITFRRRPVRAYYTDILEKPLAGCNEVAIEGNSVIFKIGRYSLANVKVEF